MAKTKKEQKNNKTVRLIVIREFTGEKPMREAFEQLIERQTFTRFEEWLESKAG